MVNKLSLRLLAGALMLAVCATAMPAFAQAVGTMKGRVVDDKGKPASEVTVTLTSVDDPNATPINIQTDASGTWSMKSLRIGKWTFEAKKGALIAKPQAPLTIRANETVDAGDAKLRPMTAAEAKGPVTAVDVEKAKLKNEEIKKIQAAIAASDASMAAGNYDDVIAKMTEIATKMEKCGACYSKMGDAYMKKDDVASAEKSYLKAMEFEPNLAAPYAALGNIYNKQSKFDEAAKMSAKANELLEAAGGGDASSAYNQGVSLWNAGKAEEAQVQFAKALKMDPKMADAHFYNGLMFVNLGKLPEAKAALQEYLKLAPTGTHAKEAKDFLAAIGG